MAKNKKIDRVFWTSLIVLAGMCVVVGLIVVLNSVAKQNERRHAVNDGDKQTYIVGEDYSIGLGKVNPSAGESWVVAGVSHDGIVDDVVIENKPNVSCEQGMTGCLYVPYVQFTVAKAGETKIYLQKCWRGDCEPAPNNDYAAAGGGLMETRDVDVIAK